MNGMVTCSFGHQEISFKGTGAVNCPLCLELQNKDSEGHSGHTDLNKLGEEAYDNAVRKGFYDQFTGLENLVAKFGTPQDREFLLQIWINHRLMLVVTELAEATEAVRNKNYSAVPKSGGVGEEIADSNIRLADLWKHLERVIGVDNATAVAVKMAFNKTRIRLHGRSL